VPPPTTELARWFAEEVQPCEPPLRAYLRKSLPCTSDVDDAMQACYLRLLRAKESGSIRATRPLLFAIARHAVHDFFARRGRVETVPVTENEILPVLDDEPGVVESICHQQELALLAEAINSLPTRCREVVLLRKIKGLPQREISELLGVPEHTVENLAVKGARLCADYLRARGIDSAHPHVRPT